MAKKKTKSKPARKPKAKGSARNIEKPEIEFIARGVLVRDGQVLLCQSIKHGYFYLPGGHVEFGESAAAAAAREIHEELGAKVTIGPLLLATEGAFSAKRKHHEINLMFHVEHPTPWPKVLSKPKSKEDHIAFRWVELAAAQDLDIRPTAVKAWLAAGCGNGQIEWVSEIA
jgi:8-oxo-dGTP pyrophosphatase MutT (NUDIX family)